IVNGNKGFIKEIKKRQPSVRVDEEIDPRFLYDFCLVFVRQSSELEAMVPQTIHNLAEDGVLWFAYPRENSGYNNSDLRSDRTWDMINSYGFKAVRLVSIDEDWSALRFRDSRFVRKRKT
ncbi:MAG: hypothetical protein KFF49_05095, partial [Bacteroidales bacterium]|nr:hypothetical protein [Bacteroidales bacterium]